MDQADAYYSDSQATLGDRLVAARTALSMSREELARRLGVETHTVAGWEEDQREPRANRLSMLAGILNVSLIWILSGEGEGVPAPEAPAAPGFHLAIAVDDLAAAEAFYAGSLGATKLSDGDACIELSFFGHSLHLHLIEREMAKPAGEAAWLPHFGVVLDWERFEDLADRLQRAGIQVNFAFDARRSAGFEDASFSIRDPAGNPLVFRMIQGSG